jgi:transposase-like protein
MWWVTSQKTGASALGLQRVLGLGSYKTAWMWLHKLRRAMVRPGRDRLAGRIEVDEVFWGAPEDGRHGRRIGNKALILIAAQEDGRGIGRIRMRQVKDARAASIHPFILDSIQPGSVVHTDTWQGYAGLEAKGYGREITEMGRSLKLGEDALPRVHRVASLLKRWLMGTHQGAVSHEHLDYYLDEFTFRFNRRTSRHRGKLFYRLVQQAAHVPPAPYKELVRHVRANKKEKHKMLGLPESSG